MRPPVRTVAPALLLALLSACSGPNSGASDGPAAATQAGPIPEGAPLPTDHPPISNLPADHPDISGGAAPAGPLPGAPAEDARTGIVLETMQTSGYTYALMDFDGDELWVAGPLAPLEEGDEVTISGLMGMTNFYARSLDRTFETIVFANRYARDSDGGGEG